MSLQHNESVHSASITKSCWEEMNTHAEISSPVDILSVTPRPTFARNITKWWSSIHVSGDHMLFRISYSLSVSSVSGTACFRHVSSSMVINHNFRQNTSVEKKKKTPSQFSGVLFCLLFDTLKKTPAARKVSLNIHCAAGYLSYRWCKSRGD